MTELNDVLWVKTTDEIKEIVEGIKGSFVEKETTGFVQKKSFSPSRLAWGSGGCPRNWYFLFKGVEGKRVDSSDSLDTMRNGTDSHARIQARLVDGPLDITIEEQLQYDDPPINSYCDAIVERPDGRRIPVEIKTTKAEAFAFRQTSLAPAEYHVFQLLVYMKILNTDLGFIMYENKNDYRKLLMPVHMDETNKKIIDDAFNWMRETRTAYLDGNVPEYFEGRRKNSKICGQCDLKTLCDSVGQGTVPIPLLKDYNK
ncbi:CRISPR/Cas system associated [Rhodococcus phage Trina]|uniref:Exonuclease n=1 Tax=Rhodococcus phage Trina TaxID=2027905 RepID=A0A2D1A271_9CAUD|nr:CRISPR/Cas system associated [Rhodococcus phage Trina]ASZ74922.1 exonuclease [Rhodococcus phage Trina]